MCNALGWQNEAGSRKIRDSFNLRNRFFCKHIILQNILYLVKRTYVRVYYIQTVNNNQRCV